jgi:outer membrane lipoprotein-sorting protein
LRNACRRPGRWLAGLAAALLLCLAAPLPAVAAGLSEQDLADIARVEEYLTGIESLRAEFIQAGPQSQLARGTLYLRRPGRLRFEYDPPSPLLVVGDGLWLVMHDRELDQVNRWPISDTPLGVLVAQDVNLMGRTQVTQEVRKPGVLALTFIDSERPHEGSATVVFSEPPLTLRQWRVTDAQGQTVDLSIRDARINVPVDPALFVFDDAMGDMLNQGN